MLKTFYHLAYEYTTHLLCTIFEIIWIPHPHYWSCVQWLKIYCRNDIQDFSSANERTLCVSLIALRTIQQNAIKWVIVWFAFTSVSTINAVLVTMKVSYSNLPTALTRWRIASLTYSQLFILYPCRTKNTILPQKRFN